ncbi:MAG TPA: ABC transporter substrate-binding protein [Euryarchaeota archaeon]|nr:nickel-binding periplasmic protein precursor [archaeon BMS3Bbin15]HDL14862.1 ABC transporter substrate-binding protein [Euryarchaeota archaeon]
MTRDNKKWIGTIFLIGALFVVFLTAGCTSHSEVKNTKAVSNVNLETQVLKVGELWGLKTLDPAKSGTLIKEKAMVVENLIEVEPDFTLKPGLATSWKRLDNTTWKIQLRKGVLFQDESPMTSKEVVWSLQRALKLNPSTASLTNIKEVKEDGTYSLLITTNGPDAALPAALAYSKLAIVSPNSNMTKGGTIIEPIGTGPFMYKAFDSTTGQLTVVKNKNYWGKKPRLDKIIIRSITDPSTRAIAIEKGEVDFTCGVPYGDVKLLQNTKGINVEIDPTARIYWLAFGSLKGTPYHDKRVRQAISYAINRKGIAEYALNGVATPAKGFFLPTMPWANKSIEGYSYDPEKAGNLLEEAGWKLNSQGIREKNGKIFSATLYTYPQRPGMKPMAEAIQSELKAVGLKVDVRVMDPSAIEEAEGPGDMKVASNAMAMLPDPDYFLRKTFGSRGAFNKWGYSNPEVDSLLAEGLSTFDKEKRQKIYDRVQEIAMDDIPVIPVAYYNTVVVMRDYVKGFVFNPTAHDYMLNPGMYIQGKK